MTGPAAWYIDEDLLDVYETLAVARKKIGDIHGVPCECCPNRSTGDEDWLTWLAEREWAVIARDSFRRPGEREAIKKYGLGVFNLRWKGELQRFDRVKLVLTRWDDMVEAWETEPRPFRIGVTRTRPPRRLSL